VSVTGAQLSSRTSQSVLDEARNLARAGYTEIQLLGQNVNSYRDPSPARVSFAELLAKVAEVPGIRRVRFTTSHPRDFTREIVQAIETHPALCNQVHLPVQSGSTAVLRRMRREYTRDEYLERIRWMRQARRPISISTDIIVGFPGETEEDFLETLSLVEAVGFDNAYVFKYSPRRNTPAAEMPAQVPEEVREERHARLLQAVNAIAERKYEPYLGRDVQVLVEGPSRKNESRLEGRTRTNKIVVFEGSPRHLGQLMDVRITRVGLFTLYGDPAILNGD